VHPEDSGDLVENEHKQARAKQDKTGNGHSQETVRSEFFTHGAPSSARNRIANKVDFTRLSSAVAAASRLP